MSPRLVVFLLALLLGIQPITTDLYLPALPALTRAFAAPVSQAQLTLAALLLAFGASQLVWGPLSDRYGRRPVLLAGGALYVAAAIGCALAPSISALVAWRAMQGAAMGATVACARAILRDVYTPQHGARAMSQALSGLGLLACLSVPIGSVLVEFAGWRWTMAANAAYGIAALVLLMLAFHETLPAERRAAVRLATLPASWMKVVGHPTFVAGAALSTASYAGLFVWLAASPFVFLQVLHLSNVEYGLVMASVSVVYIAGTFLCRRMLAQMGLRRTVVVGAFISLASGSSMGLLALAGVQATWALMLPCWGYMLGHGIHQPCGQASAVAPFPQAAGTASALNGFVMMLTAFGIGGWIGTRLDGTVRALSDGMWMASVALALIAWTLMRRYAP